MPAASEEKRQKKDAATEEEKEGGGLASARPCPLLSLSIPLSVSLLSVQRDPLRGRPSDRLEEPDKLRGERRK